MAKAPERPVVLTATPGSDEGASCLACKTREGVEERLCVARDHTGWFAFSQNCCEECWLKHLKSIPYWMPFRKGNIRFTHRVTKRD